MFYREENINEILSHRNNDILKLASKYTKLEQDGKYYVGLCPWSKHKSFIVDPENNVYTCLECGKTGNVVSFIMNAKDYDFHSAITLLAARAGVTLQTEITEKVDNTVLRRIHKEAAGFYVNNLSGSRGEKYLDKRGLDLETRLKFRLGYADGNNSLLEYLSAKGYKNSDMLASGLINVSSKGAYFDRFRNRVMFPIANADNEIIAFGGRVMDDSKPKYLNSPATRIFDKKKNLFGFNYAKHTDKGYYIVCEGYVDVISMHQAGFDNAVASLGTALTKEQVALISKYTDNVYLAYDSDGPGVKAALRAIELFNAENIKTHIILMDPCKDPDEFIKTFGQDAFMERIQSAEDSKHFKIRKLKESTDDIPSFYAEATKILMEEDT